MLTVFEVVIAAGHEADTILAQNVIEQTMAQVMTIDEAKALGFSGIREDPKGRSVRVIAVARRDARWVARELETAPGVANFTPHELD